MRSTIDCRRTPINAPYRARASGQCAKKHAFERAKQSISMLSTGLFMHIFIRSFALHPISVVKSTDFIFRNDRQRFLDHLPVNNRALLHR